MGCNPTVTIAAFTSLAIGEANAEVTWLRQNAKPWMGGTIMLTPDLYTPGPEKKESPLKKEPPDEQGL